MLTHHCPCGGIPMLMLFILIYERQAAAVHMECRLFLIALLHHRMQQGLVCMHMRQFSLGMQTVSDGLVVSQDAGKVLSEQAELAPLINSAVAQYEASGIHSQESISYTCSLSLHAACTTRVNISLNPLRPYCIALYCACQRTSSRLTGHMLHT